MADPTGLHDSRDSSVSRVFLKNHGAPHVLPCVSGAKQQHLEHKAGLQGLHWQRFDSRCHHEEQFLCTREAPRGELFPESTPSSDINLNFFMVKGVKASNLLLVLSKEWIQWKAMGVAGMITLIVSQWIIPFI